MKKITSALTVVGASIAITACGGNNNNIPFVDLETNGVGRSFSSIEGPVRSLQGIQHGAYSFEAEAEG